MRRKLVVAALVVVAVLSLGLPLAHGLVAGSTEGFGDISVVKVANLPGGEPSIASGPDGSIDVSYPGSGMSFFQSKDGGATWTAFPKADTQSGDTSVNVDSTGAIYQSNLNGISLSPNTLQGVVYKWDAAGAKWNRGGGFVTSSNSTNNPFLVDRQWADAYVPPGKTTDEALVYFTYHDWGPNTIWVNVSKDGGKTFGVPVDVVQSPQAIAASFCDTIPGNIKVAQSGPHAGRVYVLWLAAALPTNVATGCNYTQMNTFNSVWLAYSDDQGATWTDQVVFDGGFGHDASGLFADLTLDNQGNPYTAFADNLTGEWDMYVMASFDGGRTWNGKSDGTGVPYKVNGDTGTHFFPAIAVGDPGLVDVAYIRTDKVIPTTPYGKPTPGGGSGASWQLFMAQSTDLLSGNPTWRVTQATTDPIHVGDVCTLGIFCIGTLGSNRGLLDFIDLTVDTAGFAHAAYTADRTVASGGPRGIFVANQVNGQSVYPPSVALSEENPASGAYTLPVTVGATTTRLPAGTPVTFRIGSQSQTASTDANGVAQAAFTLLQVPGSYTLSAEAAGLTSSQPFTITKDTTTTRAMRRTHTLQAKVLADGSNAPVAGRIVTFSVDGNVVGTARTASNGVATLKRTVGRHHLVRAAFAGDAFFVGSEGTTS